MHITQGDEPGGAPARRQGGAHDFARPGDAPSVDRVAAALRDALADVRPGPGEAPPRPASGSPVLPDEPVPASRLVADVQDLVRGAAPVGEAGWLAHMDPPATWGSVLGAAAAAVLNNNLLMRELSPSLTELEARVIGALARELGLGPDARGTFTAGGSLGNLLALRVARDARLARVSPDGTGRGAALARLSVVTSADAHASIGRAAGVLGLDPETGVIGVAPDARGRLDPAAAADALDGARVRGRDGFALVATGGTTVLGAMDPLGPLGEVARERGAWYHVDAAYGGALALSRSRRGMLAGVEAADSVVVNPQKWLYVAKVCALTLFRSGAATGAGALPYAAPGDAAGPPPLPGLEGTRHADVLKLYLSLRQVGRRGYEALFEHGFRTAGEIAREVRRRHFLELAAEPDTNIVVFRCRADPDAGADGADPPATARLHDRLREAADLHLSLPEWRGDRWLRAVALSPFADGDTVGRLFDAVDAFAAAEGWS